MHPTPKVSFFFPLIASKRFAEGMRFSLFVSRVARACIKEGVDFWVENPLASYLWRQSHWRGLLDPSRPFEQATRPATSDEAIRHSKRFPLKLFLTDQCHWGCAYKKRTRFYVFGNWAPDFRLCPGCRKHVHLAFHVF